MFIFLRICTQITTNAMTFSVGTEEVVKMATNPTPAGVSPDGVVPCVKQVCLPTVEECPRKCKNTVLEISLHQIHYIHNTSKHEFCTQAKYIIICV